MHFPVEVLPSDRMQTLSFKVTEEEARTLRTQARRSKLSLSEFLRRKARGGGQARAAVRLVRSKRTGASVFAGSPELPPLTTASVREMLDSFP